MKRTALIIFMSLAWVWPAAAQWPVLAPEVLDTIQERKAEMLKYRQILLAETMQTQNQEQYDVLTYDIDLTIDPVAETVSGTVGIQARVVSGPLTTMEVDLRSNMTVSLVTVFGDTASFIHSNDVVDVGLDSAFGADETVEIAISYGGTPAQSGFGSFGFSTYDGKPMIWSLSEPFGSRDWWPCKDQAADKADSVNIRITIPEGMIVASNGALRSVTDNGDTETYWWHEGYPIATYLVSVAIYEYATYSDYYVYSPTDSMEIQFYVFPDHLDDVQTNYAKTKTMIEIFSNLYGEYPFLSEKYGHAEFMWGGGMEHQTCTSLGGWSEWLIAHELAHQWWGDMITCRDFHHIWLNEGFATYSEALYKEQKSGQAAYFDDINNNKYFGGGTIYVPDLSSVSRIFHGGLSYNKGSWVLHMLRHVVGDEVFFDILQAYYDSQYQYGTAVTEDFQAVCEAVSGMNLDWYFQEWIYEEYYPQYAYCWYAVDEGGSCEVTVTVEQVQTNTVVFTMPIDVTMTAPGEEETRVVFNDQQVQTFTLVVDFSPTTVALDQDGWILKSVIQRDVEITSPDGGEVWAVGEARSITWTSQNSSGYLRLDYSTNGGGTWQPVAASTPDDGSQSWTVPNTPSTNCLVRICDAEYSTCCDQSSEPFTIYRSCAMTLTSPVGGETWCEGAVEDITWSSQSTSGQVKIEYSTSGGTNWQTVVASTADDGQHPWTVPGTPSANCLVGISDVADPACQDRSDAAFTLCDEPGADFIGVPTDAQGYSCQVAFTDQSSGCITGRLWDFGDGTISTLTHPSHTFACGRSYTVSLTVSGPCGSDGATENDYITCQCPCHIELLSPNGGQIWCAGEVEDITWNSEHTGGSVMIHYSTDGGSSWLPVVDSTPDDGLRAWLVPFAASRACLVRIADLSQPQCADTSSSPFQICHCGSLEMLTEELVAGIRGCLYKDSVRVEGGCPPHVWSLSSGRLPQGLVLDDETGILSGFPGETGLFDVTVGVEDVLGDREENAFVLEVVEYVDAKGDVNADCAWNILDVLETIGIILEWNQPGEDELWRADCSGPPGVCDGNDIIDILDALKVINLILGLDECP